MTVARSYQRPRHQNFWCVGKLTTKYLTSLPQAQRKILVIDLVRTPARIFCVAPDYSIVKVHIGAEIDSHNAYRRTRNADLFPYNYFNIMIRRENKKPLSRDFRQ